MYYGKIKFSDISNGPGVRTSLYVSGCRNNCEMCFNQETWDFHYGKPFTEETIQEIIKSLSFDYISGLTLLGGEPMEEENQEALLELCKRVKEKYPTKSIWCFTGYTYDKDLISGGCKHTKFTDDLIECADVLVDGRFINRMKDIRLQFRGSSNQRIINVQATLKNKKIILDTRFI